MVMVAIQYEEFRMRSPRFALNVKYPKMWVAIGVGTFGCLMRTKLICIK
jgi:hypothetical protein